MQTESSYGRELARLRKQAGYTLQNVADCLGVSVTYVHDVEKGKRGPLVLAKVKEFASYAQLSNEEVIELIACGIDDMREARIPCQLVNHSWVLAQIMWAQANFNYAYLNKIETILLEESSHGTKPKVAKRKSQRSQSL